MDITIQRERDERQVDVFGTNRTAPSIAIQRPHANASPPLAIPPPRSSVPTQPPPSGGVAPPPPPPPPPVTRAPPEPFDFGDFANAGRVRHESPSATDDDSEPGGYEDGDVDYHQNNEPHGNDEYPDSVSEYVERPSPGFSSIEEERNALLFKIHRAIRGGMPVEKPETSTDIRDLRTIVGRIENEVALDRSIKFQRKMVCMLTSSIEWVNGRYNWADLDGWSDSVATSIQEYDDIFEELHVKYRGSMAIAPELRLVFALAASAFWFNLTKSMSKQITNSLANGGTGGSGGGLDLSALLGSMMGGVGAKPGGPTANPSPQGGNATTTKPSTPFPTTATTTQGGPTVIRKPMRGPEAGIGAMFGGVPPPVFEPNSLPRMTDSRKRDRDDDDGLDGGDRRDDKSERLSDVVSSDGSSDISDSSSSRGSYTSGSSEDEKSIKITTVPVGGGRGRGRGRGTGRGGGRGGGRGTKNVLTL